VRELRQMLRLGPGRPWDPPVLTTAALEREGIAELWSAIDDHRAHLASSGDLDAKRRARLLREVESLAAERFRLRAAETLEADDELAGGLVGRRIDPYAAAARLARGPSA